ncbi:MAG TPA: glycosyltransferase family 2 protein [Solirubrobacterales bacterium]|nr:glycosyltransferase family 2 protein [Solirubrobacterales bacterium]
MHDVCAIIVSHNGQPWLSAALGSLYESAGEVELDVVVVDNGSDGSAAWVERNFPQARTLACPNHGFGHANNRGLETADARYMLFLNPDTEFVAGSLADLVAAMDRRRGVGLAGVRQVTAAGSLAPSIRRFPSAANMFAEALGIERVPLARRALGEREVEPAPYARETPCDWTSGSFMLARREALAAAGGGFDESFFLFAEETDLCRRVKDAGWEVVHLPQATIRHFEHDRRENERMEAQAAYARMQYARKYFPSVWPYKTALALRYGLRAGVHGFRRGHQHGRARAARAGLRATLREQPPFEALTASGAQATIVSAPGSALSSTRVRSPM